MPRELADWLAAAVCQAEAARRSLTARRTRTIRAAGGREALLAATESLSVGSAFCRAGTEMKDGPRT